MKFFKNILLIIGLFFVSLIHSSLKGRILDNFNTIKYKFNIKKHTLGEKLAAFLKIPYPKLYLPAEIKENLNLLESLGFIKEENFKELVDTLKNSAKNKTLRKQINKGIIFSGGLEEVRKRTALALAKETGFYFFEISGSYLKTPKDITFYLNRIQDNTPCILFINEIEKNQSLSPLFYLFSLIELKNKDPEKIIVVIASRDSTENLDPALRVAQHFSLEMIFEH